MEALNCFLLNNAELLNCFFFGGQDESIRISIKDFFLCVVLACVNVVACVVVVFASVVVVIFNFAFRIAVAPAELDVDEIVLPTLSSLLLWTDF